MASSDEMDRRFIPIRVQEAKKDGCRDSTEESESPIAHLLSMWTLCGVEVCLINKFIRLS